MLTAVSGFLAEAGFTHSLTPARNCTFGCTYCYVPTLRVFGGLQPEDWRHWGQFTTFKPNAPQALAKALRPQQRIYCSPLVDPYQPAEQEQQAMPALLRAVIEQPPAMFVIQTRGPLILRDLDLLLRVPRLRVSFSVTTDDERVRRLYEPHCAPILERWRVIEQLRSAGVTVCATLAPLLPCDPISLIDQAIDSTRTPVIADPLHTRLTKSRGATTREEAEQISRKQGYLDWHNPDFQRCVIAQMEQAASKRGRLFGTGPRAFGWLADAEMCCA